MPSAPIFFISCYFVSMELSGQGWFLSIYFVSVCLCDHSLMWKNICLVFFRGYKHLEEQWSGICWVKLESGGPSHKKWGSACLRNGSPLGGGGTPEPLPSYRRGLRWVNAWGWPGGVVVNFVCPASAALGSQVQILGVDLHTAHQAMLWWHPTYKIEEDWYGC